MEKENKKTKRLFSCAFAGDSCYRLGRYLSVDDETSNVLKRLLKRSLFGSLLYILRFVPVVMLQHSKNYMLLY